VITTALERKMEKQVTKRAGSGATTVKTERLPTRRATWTV